MHTRKILFLLALISVFAFACSSHNMSEPNGTNPNPPTTQQPIGTEGDSSTKAPVTNNPNGTGDNTSQTEGAGSSVVETAKPSENPDTKTNPTPGGAAETIGGSTDLSITNAIRDQFATSTLPSATKIQINTQDGVVTLSGEASSQDEIQQIVTLARKVPGVREVNNQLTVAR
jgi:hyperosmotically inducible periplasmic protein